MKTQISTDNKRRGQPFKTGDAESVIRKHAFFKGLRANHLTALAECAAWGDFAPNELIFREGDPANRFYLILKGEVAVQASMHEAAPAQILVVGPGEMLGWSWLVEPYVWHFDARATKQTVAMFFPAERLRELYEKEGDLGYEMLRRVAAIMKERLETAWRRLLVPRERATPATTGQGQPDASVPL